MISNKFSNIKKLIFAAIITGAVFGLLTAPLSAAEIASGSCGTGSTYSVSDSGVLTISGSGKINDYIPGDIPWKDHESSISSVVISDGITSVGINSFINLPKVKIITVPASVTFISEHAFGYTYSGENFAKIDGFSLTAPADSAAAAYCSDNGFEFQPTANPDMTGKCGNNLTWSLSNSGTLTISGSGEMYDYTSADSTPWYSYTTGKKGYEITSVKISDGVLSVGAYAFSGCAKLQNVEIASSVTKLGKNCFAGCVFLEKIDIPASVASVPDGAFSDCISLSGVSFSNGITQIGRGSFSNTAITAVSLPSSVKSIGDNCFSGCDGLASADLKSVSKIGKFAFYSCPVLSDVKLGNELVSIGDSAFEDDKTLSSVSFPSKISQIGDRAFYGCSSLSSVILPDSLLDLGKYCFSCCTSLKSVEIGNGLTSISDGCFEACENLNRVKIGENVSEICERAFTSCKKLISLTIPKNVRTIAPYSVGYYYYEDQETGISGTYAKYKDFVPEIISGTPTAAEEYARNSDFKFTSLGLVYSDSGKINDTTEWAINTATGVIVISGVGEIPDYVSFDDTPWKIYRDNITDVVIGKDIVKIGSSCFEGCDKITSVSISGAVTEIGEYAFAGTSLETVSVPRSVTKLGDGAFAGCPVLHNVSMIDGLKYIGEKCFIGPNQLKSVFVPESVTFIGANAIGYESNETVADGFAVKGVKNSSAFNYANENGIDFRENGFIEITDKNNGCTVDILGSDLKGYELSLIKLSDSLEPNVYLTMNEYALLYDLSLTKDGEALDFDGQATVRFPIPTSINPITVRIFETDDNFDFREIHADIEQGFFVFSTEKLGKYAITNTNLGSLYTVEISYVFKSGAKAADTVVFKASSGAYYKIKSEIISGYTADKSIVSGVVENENISCTVTYTLGSDAVSDEVTEDTSGSSRSFGSARKVLVFILVILAFLLVSASVTLILLNKKHSVEKKEKERIVSRVNRADADKYANTIVIPDSDQPTKEIDIQSLFADEPEEDVEASKKIRKMRRK